MEREREINEQMSLIVDLDRAGDTHVGLDARASTVTWLVIVNLAHQTGVKHLISIM